MTGKSPLRETSRALFETTPGVVDVDDYLEADQVKYLFTVDRAKAALGRNSLRGDCQHLAHGIGGHECRAGPHSQGEKPGANDAPPADDRTNRLEHIGEIGLRTNAGGMVPLSELLTMEQTVREKAIYHKNQKPVVYVIADVVEVPAPRRPKARSMA